MSQENDRSDSPSQAPGELSDKRTRRPRKSEEDAAMLEPYIQEHIGRALRATCDDVLHEPIPEQFLALLAALEAREREGK